MRTKLCKPVEVVLPPKFHKDLEFRNGKYYYNNMLVEYKNGDVFAKAQTWTGVAKLNSAGLDITSYLPMLEATAVKGEHQLVLKRVRALS